MLLIQHCAVRVPLNHYQRYPEVKLQRSLHYNARSYAGVFLDTTDTIISAHDGHTCMCNSEIQFIVEHDTISLSSLLSPHCGETPNAAISVLVLVVASPWNSQHRVHLTLDNAGGHGAVVKRPIPVSK